MNEVTRILSAIEQGDPAAAGHLLPLVYDELRKLAAQNPAHEKPGQTLDATGLDHEAHLRLVVGDEARRWNSRGHFFAACAEAMRRILVENARRKRSVKHGGERARVDLAGIDLATAAIPEDVEVLDEPLTKLATADPKTEVVKMRFFAGLPLPEVARSALATAARTAGWSCGAANSTATWLGAARAERWPPLGGKAMPLAGASRTANRGPRPR